MKIFTTDVALNNIDTDILAVGVHSGDAKILNKLDKTFGAQFRGILVNNKFSGEFGEMVDCRIDGARADRILLFGLGEGNTTTETLRRFTGKCASFANKNKAESIALSIPSLDISQTNIEAIAESLWLSNYRFLKYKSSGGDEKPKLKRATIITSIDKETFDRAVKSAAVSTLGVTLARDLVNEPSNIVTPKYLVDTALNIAEASDKIEVGILEEKHLIVNNFGAILAVAKGSIEMPYLIHLVYKPEKPKLRVAVVGKGITFDSGGVSIKPSDKMDDMKIDMAGAASVLGLFRSLSLTHIPIEVHGVIPTCENMPSGGATKPGDVVRAYNNKTIEILNTDAEGRLVLADALSYVSKNFFPNVIIELSTLTGACLVALGEKIAGLMTDSDDLSKQLQVASNTTGEELWRLPMVNDYKEKMKSDIADIKNITEDRFAGAIMGGLFLREFVPEEIKFAHIDIAGPAWEKKGDLGYIPKGATGFGVRLLMEYLEKVST